MKYLKSFLAFEWITIIGASTVLYTRWDFPLSGTRDNPYALLHKKK
jgi:hypothetical protein